ncbi:MAG: hypothetical protein KDA25_12990 [Phycisphaerales bacterium]|nr:hypothetical protein [Phycisphaerales bacterium]
MNTKYIGGLLTGAVLILAGCQGPVQELKTSLVTDSRARVETDFGGDVRTAHPEADQYLQGVARDVHATLRNALKQSGAGGKAPIVHVLDSAEISHFHLPGDVYLTRGLLNELDNEAQLRSVLGIELGLMSEGILDKAMTDAARKEVDSRRARGVLEGLWNETAGRFTGSGGTVTDALFDARESLKEELFSTSNGTPQFGYRYTTDQMATADRLAIRSLVAVGLDARQHLLYLRLMQSHGNMTQGLVESQQIDEARFATVEALLNELSPSPPSRETRVASYEQHVGSAFTQ